MTNQTCLQVAQPARCKVPKEHSRVRKERSHRSDSRINDSFYHPMEIRSMLSRYRSRDIQLAAEAAEWLVQIDVKRTIEALIRDLTTVDPLRRSAIRETLAAFGEISIKQVMDLLDDPARYGDAVEILALMDGYAVHHMTRQVKRADSFNRTVGILAALAGHLEYPEAVTALCAGLRDPDPLIQTYVCQSLLESGPRGHRILETVFPAEVAIAA